MRCSQELVHPPHRLWNSPYYNSLFIRLIIFYTQRGTAAAGRRSRASYSTGGQVRVPDCTLGALAIAGLAPSPNGTPPEDVMTVINRLPAPAPASAQLSTAAPYSCG
jgi:hypothetical protein